MNDENEQHQLQSQTMQDKCAALSEELAAARYLDKQFALCAHLNPPNNLALDTFCDYSRRAVTASDCC